MISSQVQQPIENACQGLMSTYLKMLGNRIAPSVLHGNSYLYINMNSLVNSITISLLLVSAHYSVSQVLEARWSTISSSLETEPVVLAPLSSIIPNYFQNFLQSDTLEDEDYLFTNITNFQCKEHVSYIVQQLQAALSSPPKIPSTFVLQMVDAWGKPPSGILSGHFAVPGDFEECIKAKSPSRLSEGPIIGKYCLVYAFPTPAEDEKSSFRSRSNIMESRQAVSLPEILTLMKSKASIGPLIPQIGTCFPASCNNDDIQQLVTNILSRSGVGSVVASCRVDEKPPLDAGDMTVIVLIAIIIGTCLIGTLLDVAILNGKVFQHAKTGKPIQSLLAFSLYTNTKKWLSTEVGKDNLGCIHGLRFFSISWVVLCHTWSILQFQFPWNGVDVRTMYKSGWPIFMVINGTVSVDTFFVMGGALVAYNLLKELDRAKKLNLPMLYVHRYLRLTPTYAILLGIMATLLPYMGNGPMWSYLELESRWCQHNWWHNILYVSSIIDYRNWPADQNLCYGESWYISNDMIYFIVAPLFVYPLWRWKFAGFGLLAAWIVQCTVHIAVTTAENNISPTSIPFIRADTIQLDIYMRPWTRSAPYAVGILLGYILHNAKKRPHLARSLPKVVVALGWALSTTTALAVIFGPMRYFDPANENEAFGTPPVVAYACLHRLAWAVVIAWIIFACVHGYAGWVNTFLSWKPFMPLGRLAYCVYISSYHLQLVYSMQNYHPMNYSVYHMVYTFFSHFVASFLVGYFLTMTIESPFMQLEKLIFQRHLPPKTTQTLTTASRDDLMESNGDK